jgi:carbon storage regulator
MLVLARRVGETVVIDGGILVTVVAVQGNNVRLGVTAPPSVAVDRQEVHERRREVAARPAPRRRAVAAQP